MEGQNFPKNKKDIIKVKEYGWLSEHAYEKRYVFNRETSEVILEREEKRFSIFKLRIVTDKVILWRTAAKHYVLERIQENGKVELWALSEDEAIEFVYQTDQEAYITKFKIKEF